MASALIKGLGKLAIGAGAVYITIDQGIWSGSPKGTSTLRSLSSIPNQEGYLQQMPSAKGIFKQMQEGWNSGVKVTFKFLAAAPEKFGEASNSATTWLANSVAGTEK